MMFEVRITYYRETEIRNVAAETAADAIEIVMASLTEHQRKWAKVMAMKKGRA